MQWYLQASMLQYVIAITKSTSFQGFQWFAAMMNDTNFKEPEKFDPDRFRDEDRTLLKSNAWIPSGMEEFPFTNGRHVYFSKHTLFIYTAKCFVPGISLQHPFHLHSGNDPINSSIRSPSLEPPLEWSSWYPLKWQSHTGVWKPVLSLHRMTLLTSLWENNIL